MLIVITNIENFDNTFLGSHYPKCFFTGIDFSLEAVVGASKKRDEANAGLDNVSYMQMDGQMMKDEWTEKFDWVIMFDACHDQTRPDRVLFYILLSLLF